MANISLLHRGDRGSIPLSGIRKVRSTKDLGQGRPARQVVSPSIATS